MSRQRVAIIAHTERNYIPYVERYIDFLNRHNIEFDLYLWNREEKPENTKKNEFIYYSKPSQNKFSKLVHYLKYRNFVLSGLKKREYDKIIILTSVTGVLFSNYLFKHYSEKYLFDIRDYSFESISLYRKRMQKLIEFSSFTTISSPRFTEFLGKSNKMVVNHNFTDWKIGKEYWKKKKIPFSSKPYVISFVGGIRYIKENIALIESLKNKEEFLLKYIGKQSEKKELEDYCTTHQITNVQFFGKYDNNDKPQLYYDTDLINSVYGNQSLEVSTALPNRLYDSLLFHIPIMTTKNTYLSQLVKVNQLGVEIAIEQPELIYSQLLEYANRFDLTAFKQNSKKLLNEIKHDEEKLTEKLKMFIK